MRRARAGLTVLELLLAAVVLGVLLTLLAGLLQSTRRAYDANEQLSFEQQAVEAATELLRYELGLAGYRGADAACMTRDFGGLPALELSPGRDQITIRFFEDRFKSEPKLNEVAFKIKSNGKALVRNSNGSYFQEAAQGITGLEVTEFVLHDSSLSAQLPPLDKLAGLTVRLSFASGAQRDIPITFQNVLAAL